MIGVVTSALVIGMTTLYLHSVMTIGSQALPAPQATLMSTIIKGLLSQNLPWGLVLVGVFISITLELCGIHSLSFAVGSYLPIATTAPIFAGGLVRWFVERKTGVGRGIRGRLGHALQLGPDRRRLAGRHSVRRAVRPEPDHQGRRRRGNAGTDSARCTKGRSGMVAGGLLFAALGVVLARAAQKKLT